MSLLWVHSSDWSQLQPIKSHKLYQDLLAPYLDIAVRLAGLDQKTPKDAREGAVADYDADYNNDPGNDESRPAAEAQSRAASGAAEKLRREQAKVFSESPQLDAQPSAGAAEKSEGWGAGVALQAEEAEDVVDFRNFPRRASRGPASLNAGLNEPLSRAAYQRVLSLLSGGNCEGASQEIERSMRRYSLESDSEWVLKVRGELDSRCF